MNRVLGILFTILAIAAMVFAILNYGGYRSMLFTEETTISDDSISEAVEEAAMGEEESETIETIETIEAIEIIEAADTTKYEF